ncbi:DUF465 domain-containing protein [Rhodoblastus acidophilus]|uniref:DUF465 domain-containing protein n=1 Tax=Candidatus Rhodoblastus alkanivorans TaxID=2954117 RepID=A0ABS9ZAQ3_9HYPH|nr:DUF465 domain-containing protein [Candidatus Rhodoblastus alkanivorans]MCI4677774.1 DUF465 domain-containing protein [Candidatus Rhodoblastus alkanivorans]MCI4684728.1 DUF465 domain-containing protein [Candidatus Rhodoblastus alkanivorans]MDI4642050.1 DUF465 domain-containing protein [Rhodoblastus acidophilus]
MSLQSHLAELERRHMALQREIEKEELHPATDALKLHELKRRKLQLKDEISKLKTETASATVH